MLNVNPMQFAMNALQQNPQVMNNPQAKGLIDIIQSGDASKGEQMAMNLCKTYGVTPDQVLKEACKFFHIS